MGCLSNVSRLNGRNRENNPARPLTGSVRWGVAVVVVVVGAGDWEVFDGPRFSVLFVAEKYMWCCVYSFIMQNKGQ